MRNSLFLFILVAGIICCAGGIVLAETEQGLLLSETGDLMTGYSTVIIDGDLVYPVRDLGTGRWYNVEIIQRSADGTALCTVGEPLDIIPDGVVVDETEPGDEVVDDDSSDPSP